MIAIRRLDDRADRLLGLKEEGLEKIFGDIEMPLIEVLAHMELAGIKLDSKFLNKLSIVGNFLTMIRKLFGEKCPAKNVSENFPENIVRRKMLAKFVRRKMSGEECQRKFSGKFCPAKKFGEISTCAWANPLPT